MTNARPRSRWVSWVPAALVIGVIGAGLVVALSFLGPVLRTYQCDGGVPTYADIEGGCAEIPAGPPPAGWDGSWVCIGLCTDRDHLVPFIPEEPPPGVGD
jgi:hypothetical protein